jgi:hypothetical protein
LTAILVDKNKLIDVIYDNIGNSKSSFNLLVDVVCNVPIENPEDGTHDELAGFVSVIVSQVLDILINFKSTGGNRDVLAKQATELKESLSPVIKSGSIKNEHCAFCGKIQSEVEKIVMGLNVGICNECIELCNKIVLEEREIDAIKKKESGDI